ncbi:hypothetical protein [Gulosibacter sp. 10]|uniref:hypothetical protein n=1 Tax=Gulosibacter sp. 10 TaxID=1255570 RepID=UPI00097ECFCF|nr:hypothetical protein [Gulosibacter sp. 10]SJM58183.1 hypothetical protein FM112_05715 [Gulosibacter sp. 10]
MTRYWDRQNSVLAFWTDPVSETPEWIADRIDAFVERASASTGIAAWRLGDGAQWRGSRAERAALIRRFPSPGATGAPDGEDGYALSVAGTTADRVFIQCTVMAGDPYPGRRTPMHSVSVRLQKLEARGQDPELGLRLLGDVAVAFDPAAARWSLDGMSAFATRRGFQVPEGNATWVNDAVAAVTTVAEGVAADRVGNGVLLTTPADWSGERIAAAIRATLDANGIADVPRRPAGA